MDQCGEVVEYTRARFTTRLPGGRLYTASHYWLREVEAGVWRVGFTKFAMRMLGDLVELGWNRKAGDCVTLGQAIGWVEGFKALSDVYCAAEGEFVGGNPALDGDPALTDRDPYGEGWLYQVRGAADPAGMDVHGYAALLDKTIDRLNLRAGSCINARNVLDAG